MPECRPGFGPFAGPVGEHAVEDVERLAHLLRVRVRAEVPDAAPVALAREHDARVVVLHRDRDVRERLVVAEPDVERRPVALDEVLLQVERLDLAAGDDDLDVGDPLRQLPDLHAAVARALEVRTHARTQRLRLADVKNIAVGVPEEIDAGLRRQCFELTLNALRHGLITVAALLALTLAPAARAGGPGMLVGATEDAVRSASPAVAQKQMDLSRRRGSAPSGSRRCGRPVTRTCRRPTRPSSGTSSRRRRRTASRCSRRR